VHLALQIKKLEIDEGGLVFTHWTQLETWFLHLEFVKACHKLVETTITMSKQKGHHSAGKVPAEILQQIKKEGNAVGETVQKQAKVIRDSLVKDGRVKVMKAVKKGELGAVIDKLFGGEGLRRWIEEMVESAVEALDGVLKVKVG